MRKTIAKLAAGVSLLIVASALLGAAMSHATPGALRATVPFPISAFTHLPGVAAPPADVASALADTPGAIASSVRLLRTNVGSLRTSIYGYRATNSGLCVELHTLLAGCSLKGQHAPTLVAFSAGYTKIDGTVVPSAVVGLASDSVQTVSLIINGTPTNVPVINNSFYAELSWKLGDKWDVSVNAVTVDGAQHVTVLPNPDPNS